MTRIIAGTARGRRLTVPAGSGTRPTSDRAREALFSAVESRVGSLPGRRVLDLYAGSGAVGLEALSRGAAAATLVECDARAVRALRTNVRLLALPGAAVVVGRVERLVARSAPVSYDVSFLDPPYRLADEAVAGVLQALRDGRWLAPEGLVVVERPTRGGPLRWPAGFDDVGSRRYGEATLWYGSATG